MKKFKLSLLLLTLPFFLFAIDENDIKELPVIDKVTASIQMAVSNPDYMVTPGDVYSLNYAANAVPVSYTIAVDSTYKVRVSNLAILDANGKSYLRLKKEIEEIVQKNYPMSGVQFVLMQPSSFTVVVTGEVTKTVEKEAWALTRLADVIKGITTGYSSGRNITITSTNGKKNSYDLFKADRDGDLSQNPYLRPGDVIHVNRVDRKVTISGAVERPGTYELLPGENIKDLVYKYGNGLTNMADTSRIEITRRLYDGDSSSDYKAGLKLYFNTENLTSNDELLNYDMVYISSFTDLKPVMFIEGAVKTESTSELQTSERITVRFEYGTNYAYLVRSYSNYLDTYSADIENAYVIRNNNKIPLPLEKMLYDQSYYADTYVEANDVLIIPFKQSFVSVAGAVYKPGRYPYIPDRTYDYYVGLAGGFITEKNSFEAVEIKDIDGNKVKKSEFITPECTITAQANSALYKFNQYSGVITTVLTVLSTSLSAVALMNSLSK